MSTILLRVSWLSVITEFALTVCCVLDRPILLGRPSDSLLSILGFGGSAKWELAVRLAAKAISALLVRFRLPDLGRAVCWNGVNIFGLPCLQEICENVYSPDENLMVGCLRYDTVRYCLVGVVGNRDSITNRIRGDFDVFILGCFLSKRK